MTKVIKFPNDNFQKNSRQVVAFSGEKSKFTLGLSIFALVLGLSIFNSKAHKGNTADPNPTPTRGMRGLASVDHSQFNISNEKIIKLIESKNSRRIARLGRNPSAVDKLDLSSSILHNYVVNKLPNGLVSRIFLASGGKGIYFDGFIEDHLAAFGATSADCGEPSEVVKGKFRNSSCSLELDDVKISTVVALLTAAGQIVDLRVKPIESSQVSSQ